MINYVYLSNKDYDGSVYETQIIDWLNIYEKHGCKFYLYQFLHVKNILFYDKNRILNRILDKRYKDFKGFILQFPNTKYFYFFNAIIIIFKLRMFLFSNSKTIIFGRVLIGNEIKIIKYIFGSRFEFIYDARAASAEEIKYVSNKINNSNKTIPLYNRVLKLEYETINISKFTYCVSNKLADYFTTKFHFSNDKFFIYPCLSDDSKFFYNENIRKEHRSLLGLAMDDIVIIYSGGFTEAWHQSNRILVFFDKLSLYNPKYKFIVLTKDKKYALKTIVSLNLNVLNFHIETVKNELVVNYLNAADFGVLFREDTPMNRVSSPSKFAEYMLCGLPSLINDNVGDYSIYVQNNNCGIVIANDFIDFENLTIEIESFHVNRNEMAINAKDFFSKQFLVNDILNKFKDAIQE